MKSRTAAEQELLGGREDGYEPAKADSTRCLSCRKAACEDSGDDEVWQWRWADGFVSAMPRGLRPQLCVPCARAATLDTGDPRETTK